MAQYRLTYEFAHLVADGVTPPPGYDPNWRPMTDYIEDPDKVKFEFGASSDEDTVKEQLGSVGFERGTSGTMEIFGDAYQYTRAWLIDHEDAAINSIKVKVWDALCNKSLGIWQINTENLEWCDDGECRMNITLTEYRPLLNCLQQALIADNHRGWFPESGFITGSDTITGDPLPGYMHPRYKYCDEIHPQFLQNFLWVFAQSIGMSVGLVLASVQTVADWVGFDDFAENIDEWLHSIFDSILGCGRLHPSPFVRNYFINGCSQCVNENGQRIQFESDIFNDESSVYFNTTHLFAPEQKGLKADSDKDWIQDNKPIYTVNTYAYSLKDIFNAKYGLRDGIFYFNRKDTYPPGTVLDLTGDDGSYMLGYVCYNSNSSKKRYAATKMNFAQDSQDLAGNQALHRYNGVKQWTYDFTRYAGTNEIQIEEYSVARWTTDGVEQKAVFAAEGLGMPIDDYWPADQLLMEKDTTTYGKLIIWDGVSTVEEAQAMRVNALDYDTSVWPLDYVFTDPSNNYWIFNYPMFFDPRNSDGGTGYPTRFNIYNLHRIDDPTQTTLLNKTWEVTLELCCVILNKLIFDDAAGDGVQAHLDYLVQVNVSEKGTIERLTIDYEKNEVKISGAIKYNI